MNRIYLDHAATTPLDPAVLDAMLPYLTGCQGNPSGIHETAREARAALDQARRTAAAALGVKPGEVYFTSGGSESDNWALRGIAEKRGAGRIIVSAIEHHAVLHSCDALRRQGFDIVLLPVGADGTADPDDLRQAMRPGTILVSVMTANNEIGTIQPVRKLARIAHEGGALFHTDAVQAAGTIPVRPAEDDADLLSLSAHKFYGPKGAGALIIRRDALPAPLIRGGAQERGQRAGTENVAGIVGLAKALELACGRMAADAPRIAAVRDRFIARIKAELPDTLLNGGAEHRLPGNANLRFPGTDGIALLMRLDMAGIAASAGSACAAGSLDPSHVLLALGLSRQEAAESVRFTFGRHSTEAEADEAAETVVRLVRELRA